jgi:hypothetical protein
MLSLSNEMSKVELTERFYSFAFPSQFGSDDFSGPADKSYGTG